MNCNQPDRDVPKLKCGVPIPCPHHTAEIDEATGRVMIPSGGESAWENRKKLKGIASILKKEEGHEY